MESLEQLRELFAYNDWANRRIAVALKAVPVGRGHRIFAHLLTAEKEWYERLYGKDSTGADFWPQLTADESGNLARETAMAFETLLRRFEEEGLELTIRYRTSSGEQKESAIREILTHILIHSATHRGNIILKIREDGFEPPTIDYIVYLRETKYI
ncbi:MAG: hypothetical protein C4324_07450 [Blastocatellia bacterium]